MNNQIYLIVLFLALVTVIPTASAQLSLGIEANQELIEVELNKSGIVKDIFVKEGENVEAGYLLLKVENSNFKWTYLTLIAVSNLIWIFTHAYLGVIAMSFLFLYVFIKLILDRKQLLITGNWILLSTIRYK